MILEVYNRIQKKYSSLAPPVKATFWFLMCNLVTRALGFITAPVFTRILPEEQYGRMSIIMTYEQIVIILSTWEIYSGAFQKGIYKYKEEITEFSEATILLMNIITVVFFGGILVFERSIESFTGMGYNIVLFMFAYCMVFPAFNMWIISERSNYRYKNAVVITVVHAIISASAQIFAVLLIGRTAEIKYEAGIIISLCIYMWFYVPHARFCKIVIRLDKLKKYWFYAIRYQAPLLFHSLSYLILGQADRLMIGRMVGDAQAGYYSVAYSLASIVSIATNSINQSLVPWRYEQLEKRDYIKIKTITNKILIVIACFLLAVVFIFPEVMKILFPENYRDAMWCMPPVAVSIFFIFMYSVFVSVETYYEKTTYVSIVSVSCGLVNVGLNYIFIQKYGYLACGYTTLASYIMFAVGHYYFMKKVLKDKCVDKNIFDGRILLLMSLLLLILMIVITCLYRHEIIRYMLLLLGVFFAVMRRKQIRQCVNEIFSKQ